MKMYLKISKTGLINICRETTWQSIISDLFTILAIVVLIGSDIVFSLLVTRSIVIDFVVIFLFAVYILNSSGRKYKNVTKKELLQIINESFPEE